MDSNQSDTESQNENSVKSSVDSDAQSQVSTVPTVGSYNADGSVRLKPGPKSNLSIEERA